MKLSDIPIVVADSSTSALSTSTAPAKPTPALAAGAPAAASPGVIHPTVGQSLRRKAVIVFTCLVAYVMAVGIYLYSERDDLVASVHALEAVHQDHELLTRVNAVVSQAILVVNEAHFAADREPDWGALAISVESVQAGLLAAASRADELGTLAVGLQQLVGHLLRDRSRQRLTELRASIQGIVGRLDVATAGLRDRRQHLSLAYRRGFDQELLMKAVGFATVGLTIFGSVMALFFARLAWDIRRLERRAMRIVSGYRGSSLKVTRDDEVGALMQSVNQMQCERAPARAGSNSRARSRCTRRRWRRSARWPLASPIEIDNPRSRRSPVSPRRSPSHGRPVIVRIMARRAGRNSSSNMPPRVGDHPADLHLQRAGFAAGRADRCQWRDREHLRVCAIRPALSSGRPSHRTRSRHTGGGRGCRSPDAGADEPAGGDTRPMPAPSSIVRRWSRCAPSNTRAVCRSACTTMAVA